MAPKTQKREREYILKVLTENDLFVYLTVSNKGEAGLYAVCSSSPVIRPLSVLLLKANDS